MKSSGYSPYGVAVDPANNLLYWADIYRNLIQQAMMVPLTMLGTWRLGAASGVHGLALDLTNGYITMGSGEGLAICARKIIPASRSVQ